jgi:hypothetical protein
MQADGQALGKSIEVPVRREDGHVVPYRNGADEEVRVGALNPFGAAQIENFAAVM